MPTETTLNSLKVHKVPDFETWEENYNQVNGIGTNDVVVIPPEELKKGVLPEQTNNSGKFLTTDGSGNTSWATVDALPSQSGNSGKYLTTNGSAASWATVSIPSAADATPIMDGTAAVGTSTDYAREDHVHPTDTSRAASSHSHGNITNGGDITATAPTIANGDQIIINDNSASKITNGPTFDGSTTNKYLSPKGTWESIPVTSVNSKTGAVSLSASDVSAVATSAVGANSGVAPLNASGKIDSTYLPSYVDDVIEGYYYNSKFYEESAHTTQLTGESGKIYVDLSTEKTYRYSGTAYVEIAQGSIVSISRDLTSGIKIGTLTINGTGTDLYAPTSATITDLLPSQTGNNGKYLKTNGSVASWENAPVTSVNSKTGAVTLDNTDVGAAATSHAHGNITSGGDITATAPTIANGDQIIINDNSASKITNGPTFDGSTTSKYLSQKGTWESVPTASSIGAITSESDPFFSASAAAGITSANISTWNGKQDALPSQTNNSGKFLTTNGSALSWGTVDALPSQTNNSGKYLTTNGTSASWATITDNDTKNTAGSTNTSSKIYLIGATSQAANPQTYSDDEVYATSGVLSAKTFSGTNAELQNIKMVTTLTAITSNRGDLGSGTSPRYLPYEWYASLGHDPVNGEIIVIRTPSAGNTAGVYLSINGNTTAKYYPIATGGTSRVTTHFAQGTTLMLVYESAMTVTTYALAGADATSTITGIWRVLNFYDANTNTLLRTYKATNNIDLPLLLRNSTASQTAANASISTYHDSYGAIANADSPTINPSTGVLKAKSPEFSGTPTAPTATAGTNTTQIATTAFVQSAVSGIADNDHRDPGYGKIKPGTASTSTSAITTNTTAAEASTYNETLTINPGNKWIAVAGSNSSTAGSDTFTIGHAAGITAKSSYGSTATTASANGGTIKVTDVQYDAAGHITASTDRTITLSQSDTRDPGYGKITPAGDTGTSAVTANTTQITAKNYNEALTIKTGNKWLTVAGTESTTAGQDVLTIGHSAGLTAKTSYGSTSTTASANGGTITVTDIKYDQAGHITASTDRTITLSQSTTPASHASTATTYGIGTGSNYGHVKLSDSTSTTSGASAGIAATPTAVKAAYDLAVARTKIYTASCSTAAGTTAKVATLDDSTGFSLAAGVMVVVRFTNGNTATTPTLNVSSSGAKTIAIPSSATEYVTGNGTTYNSWGAYESILFTYTGTYWVHIPSGYLGYLAYNAAASAGEKTLAQIVRW